MATYTSVNNTLIKGPVEVIEWMITSHAEASEPGQARAVRGYYLGDHILLGGEVVHECMVQARCTWRWASVPGRGVVLLAGEALEVQVTPEGSYDVYIVGEVIEDSVPS